MSTTSSDPQAVPATHGGDHAHAHHVLTEENRAHFDKIAADMEDFPQARAHAKLIANTVLEENWMHMRDEQDGDEVNPFTDRPMGGTRMLEFACGTGLVSRELAPFVAKIVGLDISQSMVDLYNKKAKEKGYDPEDVHAVCFNLLGEDESVSPEVQTAKVLEELGGERFDLIICTAAFHHLSDPARITKALSALLAPKGSLFVSDIFKPSDDYDFVKNAEARKDLEHMPESVRDMSFAKTVSHRGGFAEADMKKFLEGDGGLTDFAFRLIGKMDFFAPPPKEGDAAEGSKHETGGAGPEGHQTGDHGHGHGHGPIELFIAKGTKPE